jgi:hypothetical protein
VESVVEAVGLTMAALVPERPDDKPLIVKTCDYGDENGEVPFQAVRYEPKSFRCVRLAASRSHR